MGRARPARRPVPEIGCDPEQARRYALAHAPRLRAFDPRMFGLAEDVHAGPEPTAELLAGSLFAGVHQVFDGLYRDLDALQRIRGTVANLYEPSVLDELPAALADRYDTAFVRRFLLVAGTGAHRLVEPYWQPPSCFAEALAVRMVFRRAHGYLTDHGLLAGSDGYFEELTANAFDPEHLLPLQLLDAGTDPFSGVPCPRGPSAWFTAVDDLCSVHPYAADAPEP
ncbi:hypothetical protein [Allosalinactinospora lopnorensis]|uniref:hypothetical protein n=1 Tax=Allosalinactinospora lopnorensis TaxID=1352348 RepID=UPI000623F828|nr:hypothetical protein [Allosalinactinospora lopnorensis]